MNSKYTVYLALVGSMLMWIPSARAAAARSNIAAPDKRRATVELAAKLAAKSEPASRSPGARSPFDPAAGGESSATGPSTGVTTPGVARPGGALGILQAAAAAIQPRGTISFGGEQYLLVGQQRLKEGDTLNVTIENSAYPLVIVDIESSEFTLQYQDQKLTRPASSQPAKSQ